MKRIVTTILMFLSILSYSQDTCVWTGDKSNRWTHSKNWENRTTPSSSSVIIITGSGYFPRISSGTFNTIIFNEDSKGIIRQYNTITVNKIIMLADDIIGDLDFGTSAVLNCDTFIIGKRFKTGYWDQFSMPFEIHADNIGNKLYLYDDDLIVDNWAQGWKITHDTLIPGLGYDYKNSSSVQDYMFSGDVEFIDYTLITKYNNAGDTSIHEGWNLLGNPYLCHLDWDQVTFNNTERALYIWDAAESRYATYVDGVSINGGSRYLPPTYGFWIKALPGGGDISFTTDAMTFPAESMLKSSSSVLKLSVEYSWLKSECAVKLNYNATEGFDPEYDARLKSNMLSIYYKHDTIKLGVNSISDFDSIPIEISCNFSNELKVTIEEMSGFGDLSILGEQIYEGYQFTFPLHNKGTFYIKKYTAPIIEDPVIEDSVVIDDPVDTTEIIVTYAELYRYTDHLLMVCDIMGRRVNLNGSTRPGMYLFIYADKVKKIILIN